MNEQKASKQIALIKAGDTIAQIKLLHGDFEDWFAEGLNPKKLLVNTSDSDEAKCVLRKFVGLL